MKRIAVVGTGISTGSFEEQVALIMGWAQRGESRTVCVACVHGVMEAYRDPGFAEILRQADLVTPDGMPLVWVMRRRGAAGQERVAGMDLMPALCAEAEGRGVPVFFLGCTEDILQAIQVRLAHEYAGLRIAGMVSPPFRPPTVEEDEALVAQINASGAGLCLVALGCPKQERWMDSHRGQVRSVMVGLGGAFPVFAGLIKRAPPWMQRSGLEWTYRLKQEPLRLWKRYFICNSLFIWQTWHIFWRTAASVRR